MARSGARPHEWYRKLPRPEKGFVRLDRPKTWLNAPAFGMSVGVADPISEKLGDALRLILCNGVKIQAGHRSLRHRSERSVNECGLLLGTLQRQAPTQ